ncbi:MAG: hypothetical protein WBI10_10920 [Syntrophales bacterium]
MRYDYREAKRLSRKISSAVGPPRFYLERQREVGISCGLFRGHPLVRRGLSVLRSQEDHFGHGILHAARVAIDAGALVMMTSDPEMDGYDVDRLMLLAHLAGVFHDLRRFKKHHAKRSAEEAGPMLRASFGLQEAEVRAITKAIGNHEAFQPVEILEEPLDLLIADALYDADKFRWGPDNFTEMLWSMLERRNVPISAVMDRYLEGLEGIEKIRSTFRSKAGREYGPDFIDRGMEIGRRLYGELLKIC